jgi:hypothetical protein
MTKSFLKLMVFFHQPWSCLRQNATAIYVARLIVAGITAKLTGFTSEPRSSEVLGSGKDFKQISFPALPVLLQASTQHS